MRIQRRLQSNSKRKIDRVLPRINLRHENLRRRSERERKKKREMEIKRQTEIKRKIDIKRKIEMKRKIEIKRQIESSYSSFYVTTLQLSSGNPPFPHFLCYPHQLLKEFNSTKFTYHDLFGFRLTNEGAFEIVNCVDLFRCVENTCHNNKMNFTT